MKRFNKKHFDIYSAISFNNIGISGKADKLAWDRITCRFIECSSFVLFETRYRYEWGK